MADTAREQIDVDIERAKGTRDMLRHLADAIEHGPTKQSRGETYQSDAIEALEHGSELAAKEMRNLRHVGAIWDEKVSQAVPEWTG